MSDIRVGNWVTNNADFPNLHTYFKYGPQKVVRTKKVNLEYAGNMFVFIKHKYRLIGLYKSALQKVTKPKKN